MEENSKLSKWVSLWFWVGCIGVIAMVIVGGITRLTGSGLSITDWRPVTGMIPPLSEQDWLQEFAKYKDSPEFIKMNNHFTLENFKKIFFWEYLHRLIGRLLGFIFIIPFIYFLIKRRTLKQGFIKWGVLVFLLGGLQGFAGWYMVKSGLLDTPHVSHYRLAIHLVLAFSIAACCAYAAMIYAPNTLPKIKKRHATHIRNSLWVFITILTIQIIFLAFTAGLKAGYMFNTFPLMEGSWLPDLVIQKLGTTGNPKFVQYFHRWMGIFTFIISISVIRNLFRSEDVVMRRVSFVLLTMVSIQVGTGIFTLLYFVPVYLGVIHQLGAAVLVIIWTVSLYLLNNAKILVQKKKQQESETV